MKNIQYKTFSWNTHRKNWQLKRPNVCQFELTFRCPLHCKHCYADCYNKPAYFKKELSTKEVKLLLDKCYEAGVIWVCFTGGDPLARKDFLEVYSYAKEKGFIVTVFTSGCLITERIIRCFRQSPPFVIEMTLNGATKDLYEDISQVRGSFQKAVRGIKLILEAKLALTIKTQVTKDNISDLDKIRNFVQRLGLRFRPSLNLHARLNGELAPCRLRISPEEISGLGGNSKADGEDCRRPSQNDKGKINNNLFTCAIGGSDGIHIDPYGNAFACSLMRKPAISLLKLDINYVRNNLPPLFRNRKFTRASKCRSCNLRQFCIWCPAKACLETGDMETPIGYYCRLAKAARAK